MNAKILVLSITSIMHISERQVEDPNHLLEMKANVGTHSSILARSRNNQEF